MGEVRIHIYYSKKSITQVAAILIVVVLCVSIGGATYCAVTQLGGSSDEPTPTSRGETVRI